MNKCDYKLMKSIYLFLLYFNHCIIIYTGIPELNIPTLEPFVIQELDLKIFQGLGAAVLGGGGQKSDKHKAFARNLVIHHSSEFNINELKQVPLL